MKRNDKILNRAKSYIQTYSNNEDKYYKELVRSYKEYSDIASKDSNVDDIYIKHIDELCNFIHDKNHTSKTLFIMLVMFIIMVLFAGFSTYKYYDASKNLKKNIIKNNNNTMIINYDNFEDFEIDSLDEDDNYIDIKPIIINIKSNNIFHYNIYLIPDNYSIASKDLIDIKDISYNVSTNKKDSGVKKLGNCFKDNNRLLLFSDNIEVEDKNIEFRLWINKEDKKLNKKYKFKLYVDGYLK